jgi:hypothetical protein
MEPLIAAVSLIGFVFAAWRTVHYMIDNPPRYTGTDDE